MYGRSPSDRIRYWMFVDRIPVTKVLIVSNILTFLLITLFKVAAIAYYLGFSTSTAIAMPWTLFTYPLVWVDLNIINLLLACYWLWFVGGSLERSWGSRTFGIFFFVISAISAVGLFIGSMLAHVTMSLFGLWLPVAAVTIAFAMLNPEQQILFFFVIPMKLKYLAMIDAAFVFIMYGRISLILGIFALTGCAASYWYVRHGMSFNFSRPRYQSPIDDIQFRAPYVRRRTFNPFKWFTEYREKKRLKDFFDR